MEEAIDKVTEQDKEVRDPDAAGGEGPDDETASGSVGVKTKIGPRRGDETDESGPHRADDN